MDENERLRLRVCSAILTNSRPQLEWALTINAQVLGHELTEEVAEALRRAPIPGKHGLVRLTMYLPAWAQYLGQRLILLYPKLAQRLLRSSGLHHQMY